MSGRAASRWASVFVWVPRDAGTATAPGVLVARRRYHRTLFLVIGFWAFATCAAAAVYPAAAFGVAVLGVAHVVVGYRVEQHRRSARP